MCARARTAVYLCARARARVSGLSTCSHQALGFGDFHHGGSMIVLTKEPAGDRASQPLYWREFIIVVWGGSHS